MLIQLVSKTCRVGYSCSHPAAMEIDRLPPGGAVELKRKAYMCSPPLLRLPDDPL